MSARDEAIGRRLRTIRDQAGITRDDVAAHMRLSGFRTWSRDALRTVEAGARRLQLAEATALAELLLPTVDTAAVLDHLARGTSLDLAAAQ